MFHTIKKMFKSEMYFLMITPALAWQCIFLCLPIVFVLSLGFYTGTSQDLFQVVSLQNFYEVVQWPQLMIIARSIVLASVTSWVCLLMAYPIAYFLAIRVSNKYRLFFLMLISIPFLINLLIQVYAWFFILERQGFVNQTLLFLGIISKPLDILNTDFAIYLVMFHVYLPFMIMPIYAVLEKFDVRLLEVSYDLGASFRRTFWHVILPFSMSGIKSGFFLVYVISFGEYVVPALMGGMKTFFVGTLISEYFFIGKDWHVGAAFTCLSCLGLLVTVVIYHMIFSYINTRTKKLGV